MTDAFAIMSGLLFAACHGSNDGKDRDRALMGYVFEDMYDILAASVLAMDSYATVSGMARHYAIGSLGSWS